MAHWLMKSEPSEFGIDDLEACGTEPWDGIRNYQARNMIRDEMKPGDQAFFYHSSCAVPGIVGIMEIATAAYPDPTAFDPDGQALRPRERSGQPPLVPGRRALRTQARPHDRAARSSRPAPSSPPSPSCGAATGSR